MLLRGAVVIVLQCAYKQFGLLHDTGHRLVWDYRSCRCRPDSDSFRGERGLLRNIWSALLSYTQMIACLSHTFRVLVLDHQFLLCRTFLSRISLCKLNFLCLISHIDLSFADVYFSFYFSSGLHHDLLPPAREPCRRGIQDQNPERYFFSSMEFGSWSRSAGISYDVGGLAADVVSSIIYILGALSFQHFFFQTRG